MENETVKHKINRLISATLSVILMLSILMPIVASATSTPFEDVPENAWFAEPVAWAYSNEITAGTTATTFSPDAYVTRGEFVTFLYREKGEPATGNIVRFLDVTDPFRFYFTPINWAAINGIAAGFPDGDFRPNAPISRQELATMLYRFAALGDSELIAPADTLLRFSDSNRISDFAITPMQWAINRGIVRGNAGRVLPRDTATRAESLTMLHRYVMNEPFSLPPITNLTHGGTFNGAVIGGPARATANDRIIWDFLLDQGLNQFAVAGIMGNLYAESGLQPTIVERARRYRLINVHGMPEEYTYTQMDAWYTAEINAGRIRREDFRDGVGYGLAQWTFADRKDAMHRFILARQAPGALNIGCLDAQLAFLWDELYNTYHRATLDRLEYVNCLFEASNIVLMNYKRPANQGLTVQGTRAGFALGYFNRFAVAVDNIDPDDVPQG